MITREEALRDFKELSKRIDTQNPKMTNMTKREQQSYVEQLHSNVITFLSQQPPTTSKDKYEDIATKITDNDTQHMKDKAYKASKLMNKELEELSPLWCLTELAGVIVYEEKENNYEETMFMAYPNLFNTIKQHIINQAQEIEDRDETEQSLLKENCRLRDKLDKINHYNRTELCCGIVYDKINQILKENENEK